MADELGARIKRYEQASRHTLTPRMPVMVRVDGRAFHTFTKHMKRPFDHDIMGAMSHATWMLAKQMQGFQLAYTQSDEASFLITDTESLTSEGWFGYNLNKIVSLSASIFSLHFYGYMMEADPPGMNGLPAFDARAFNIPIEDAPNAFCWRQQDWERNSLQMLASSLFSHSALQGKKKADMHNMLHEVGVNWADLSPAEKNGTFITKDFRKLSERLYYNDIKELIEAPKAERGIS